MQCVNSILKYTTQTWVTYHNYNLYNLTRILQYRMYIPHTFIAHYEEQKCNSPYCSVATFAASLYSDPLSSAKVRDSTSCCAGQNHTANISYGKKRIT